MAENKGYMQYAMLFGTYLGGYWILKFILFPLGLTIPFLSFLFVGLTLCVPFMGYLLKWICTPDRRARGCASAAPRVSTKTHWIRNASLQWDTC